MLWLFFVVVVVVVVVVGVVVVVVVVVVLVVVADYNSFSNSTAQHQRTTHQTNIKQQTSQPQQPQQ
jgi:cytoskeletal protein RodZ